MHKVILNIALSLNGYIADIDGGFSFLDHNEAEGYNYEAFLETVDAIIMGYKSYEQAANMFDDWQFPNHETFVYTHKKLSDLKNIHFVSDVPDVLIEKIKSKNHKNIWLFGGGTIVSMFAKMQCIDEYRLYYVPEVLPTGISLFNDLELKHQLKTISVKQYGQVIEIICRPK